MDGTGISHSSLSEERPQGLLSIFDAKLHVLSRDDSYDLAHKRPIAPEA
jgi:cyanophycinase